MLDADLISQLTVLASVVLIDIVLAGDNAVVVGTAAAGLPAAQQRRVIVIGASLALVARVLFALIATQLLAIIGLLFAGGLLLLWVAWKIWRDLRAHGHAAADAAAAAVPKTMRSAIVQVAVADQGPGLPDAEPERLFQPFFTTRSDGTGLGLALVQKFIVTHNGHVRAGNRPEGGAVFLVRLPLRPADAARVQ